MSWLTVIGIGEDGVDGLSSKALQELEQAEIIVGGQRHHEAVGALGDEIFLHHVLKLGVFQEPLQGAVDLVA